MVLLVEIKDVEVVGPEPAQARLGTLDDPSSRQPSPVRPWPDRVGDLCGHHPGQAILGDGATDDLLRAATGVDVSRVDKIDPGLRGLRDDARSGRLVARSPEHHRSQADRRDVEAGAAELAIDHIGRTTQTDGRGMARLKGALQIVVGSLTRADPSFGHNPIR
jgi:hypothetical protein